ncbi:MAG: thymidylate synthase [Nanobdellota archaeon]
MIHGQETGTALCTCWADTQKIPDPRPYFQLTGNLYSPTGIAQMIQTLAATPSLKQVILWPHDQLSQTPIGKKGWMSLKRLWEKGLCHQNTIKGTGITLPKEITPQLIQYLRKHIHLMTDNRPFHQIAQNPNHRKATRKAFNISLTPPKDTTAPSERCGFLIRAQTIEEAHAQVVQKIMRYGITKQTEYDTKEKELLTLTWVIEKPTCQDSTDINAYRHQLLDPHCPPEISYTYGQRLRDYEKTDQIDKIIQKLKESPITRRAVATTHNPKIDNSTNSPPCLGYLHFIRDDTLHLTAFFRSHDMMKGAKANAYALTGLMEHVAKAIGTHVGTLSIISNSAHIYEHDFEEAKKEKPETNPQPDPRGTLIIETTDTIHLTLQGYDGKTITTLQGDADTLMDQLTGQELLSQHSHYLYAGKELQKAQTALDFGMDYIQDKPLTICR